MRSYCDLGSLKFSYILHRKQRAGVRRSRTCVRLNNACPAARGITSDGR